MYHVNTNKKKKKPEWLSQRQTRKTSEQGILAGTEATSPR